MNVIGIIKKLALLAATLLVVCGCKSDMGDASFDTPYAEYVVSGTVTDAESGKELSGIGVKVEFQLVYASDENGKQVVTTAVDKHCLTQSGRYSVDVISFPVDRIVVTAGGFEFATEQIIFDISASDYDQSNDGLYKGCLSKTFNLALKRVE